MSWLSGLKHAKSSPLRSIFLMSSLFSQSLTNCGNQFMSPKKTPVHFLDLLKVVHVAMIKDKENIEK